MSQKSSGTSVPNDSFPHGHLIMFIRKTGESLESLNLLSYFVVPPQRGVDESYKRVSDSSIPHIHAAIDMQGLSCHIPTFF
jgi:hypothetical protein